MFLPDHEIRAAVEAGVIGIEPFDPGHIQPASIDVTLGTSFRVFESWRADVIDLADPPRGLTAEVVVDGVKRTCFTLHPGEFCLAETAEYIAVPASMLGMVEGKSSIGRLGLIVETAGVVDGGFEGTITLEFANLTRLPIRLHPGLPIAQLTFAYMNSLPERPYGHPALGSHYQGQRGATESRYQQ